MKARNKLLNNILLNIINKLDNLKKLIQLFYFFFGFKWKEINKVEISWFNFI